MRFGKILTPGLCFNSHGAALRHKGRNQFFEFLRETNLSSVLQQNRVELSDSFWERSRRSRGATPLLHLPLIFA